MLASLVSGVNNCIRSPVLPVVAEQCSVAVNRLQKERRGTTVSDQVRQCKCAETAAVPICRYLCLLRDQVPHSSANDGAPDRYAQLRSSV